MEAVRTNVLGTENVLNSAIENKVKRVVVLQIRLFTLLMQWVQSYDGKIDNS